MFVKKAQSKQEMDNRIKQQMEELKQQPSEEVEAEPTYTSIIMDEFGNLVDETGKIIQKPKKAVITTKINQKRIKEQKENALKIERPPNIKKSEFFDSTLSVPRAEPKKRKRGLLFHEKGEFIEKAKMMRELEEEERKKALERQLMEQQKKEQELIQKEMERQRLIQEEKEIGELHWMLGCWKIEDFDLPSVYWWDKKILKSCKKNEDLTDIDPYLRDYNEETGAHEIKEKMVVHNFVEHPIKTEPLKKKQELGPLPLMLTKKEQKKMKKQQKIQKEKETQRKIRLGLIPPPPPKANMKNYMTALMASGEDPTEIEMRIKKEIEDRIKAHEERNATQKLTKEQKREKKLRKIQEDAESDLLVALYLIPNLSHPQTRFKVGTAREKGITGGVFSCKNTEKDNKILLIAEGGKKALKKYDDVILNRIEWSKKEGEEDAETDESVISKLLWKGSLLKRNFTYFKFQQFEDDDTLKNYLKDQGCSHYYDIFHNDLSNNTPLL